MTGSSLIAGLIVSMFSISVITRLCIVVVVVVVLVVVVEAPAALVVVQLWSSSLL